MSEPAVGTDVLGMSTNAKREGDSYAAMLCCLLTSSYILNGTKMWITNGVVNGETGDAFLVYAKTSPKDISFFIVEKVRAASIFFTAHQGMPGFSVGQQLKGKCGMRASNTAELVLQGVKVPLRNRIGMKPTYFCHSSGDEGEAMKHMMRNLEIERIGLAAMSLGIGRRSIEVLEICPGFALTVR